MPTGDITKLRASWTKYDSVKAINIIGNDELDSYIKSEEGIDAPVLKAYLGINSYTDTIPQYWKEVIRDYPKERKMFALLAGIFTHYENIRSFSENYSSENMGGVFAIGNNTKHDTNLRSALVEGGAASNSYRRKPEVPYSFTKIFEVEDIGRLFKQLLKDRLIKIGYTKEEVENDFLKIAIINNFHKALSLTEEQFTEWLDGKAIYQGKLYKYDLISFENEYKNIQAIKVEQWLQEWDSVDFDQPMRKKPENHFYIFRIDIRLLKRISDVHRRKAQSPRIDEINVQRPLKEDRSLEIRNYVESGFPLSTLNDKNRKAEENKVLQMPGFLPTAILVNILGPDQKRGNSAINSNDLIKVNSGNNRTEIVLPNKIFQKDWNPELKPIEIIDGQHRLWAFDETELIKGKYEVPVIAYYNLDRAWQAYMFYMINIKPKKINTSLGYDLYPLLRTQEWLENSKEGLKVYRETRAQELVEALWSYEESPWYRRISMLGEDAANISQNAFIRALSDSYLKKSRKSVSGLFGDVLKNKEEEIKWVRAQQAAFLVLLWDEISKALDQEVTKQGTFEWVDKLRIENFQLTTSERELLLDKSFASKNSNLSRDQGVTGILMFSNDFFYVLANSEEFDLNELEWDEEIDERQIASSSIDSAIKKFKTHAIYKYIQMFVLEVIKLDWRTSSAEFDNPLQSDMQKKYRGSGGYREIWNDLLKIFLSSPNELILKYSNILLQSN